MDCLDIASFVGREDFLRNLHALLQRNQRVVIAGAPGVGKTATAQEYISCFSQEYKLVCWINAATEETLLADLLLALQSFSLPTETAEGLPGLFKTLHNYMAGQQNTLLVLDHFSFPFQLQSSPGEQQQTVSHLLLITHLQDTPAEIPRLELAGLNEHEGALLVLRRSGLLSSSETLKQAAEAQRAAALELARELHGAPIALNLAGGYLRVTGGSIQDYLFSFRDYPARLPQSARADSESAPEVMVACELSLAYLERARPAALECLQVCALLASEAIPGALFQPETAPVPRTDEQRTDQQAEEIQALLAAGLLATEKQLSLLRMHPLLQEIVCQFSPLDQRRQHMERALRLFHQLLPALEAEALPTRVRVAGHIRHLAQFCVDEAGFSTESAEVFSWAASLLWEQKMIGPAETLLRSALDIWERVLGYAHPTVATVLSNLAVLNGLLKNYVEAEALSHRAIASKAGALGAGHPDVLLALANLGHIYAAQGKQNEAKLCYEKTISIGDRTNLQQHPAYSAAMYDLALFYIEQEQFSAAEPLLRKVCSARDAVPGPRDPSTMAAWFSLAEVSARLKNWKRAEASYWHALPVCERLLGAEHPVTLDHLERAAHVFLQRGKLNEARQAFQRVLEVRERAPGLDTRHVVTCLNGLARVAQARDRFPEAQAFLERAQSLYAEQAGPEDLALAELLDTSGSLEAARRHYEQALFTYKRAYDLRVRILGEEHLELVENLINLGVLYLKLEQSQQAEPLLLQALYIYQNEGKPEDMVLDPALNGLAEIEIGRGHFEIARMYLERSRTIRVLALGRAHPGTAEVLQKLEEVSHAQIEHVEEK